MRNNMIDRIIERLQREELLQAEIRADPSRQPYERIDAGNRLSHIYRALTDLSRPDNSSKEDLIG